MVDHLVISNREQVRFTFLGIYIVTVSPHFFKRGLHHVSCVLLMPKILQDEAIHIVCISSPTFIIFLFGHKTAGISDKSNTKATGNGNTSGGPGMLLQGML